MNRHCLAIGPLMLATCLASQAQAQGRRPPPPPPPPVHQPAPQLKTVRPPIVRQPAIRTPPRLPINPPTPPPVVPLSHEIPVVVREPVAIPTPVPVPVPAGNLPTFGAGPFGGMEGGGWGSGIGGFFGRGMDFLKEKAPFLWMFISYVAGKAWEGVATLGPHIANVTSSVSDAAKGLVNMLPSISNVTASVSRAADTVSSTARANQAGVWAAQRAIRLHRLDRRPLRDHQMVIALRAGPGGSGAYRPRHLHRPGDGAGYRDRHPLPGSSQAIARSRGRGDTRRAHAPAPAARRARGSRLPMSASACAASTARPVSVCRLKEDHPMPFGDPQWFSLEHWFFTIVFLIIAVAVCWQRGGRV